MAELEQSVLKILLDGLLAQNLIDKALHQQAVEIVHSGKQFPPFFQDCWKEENDHGGA